MKNAKLKIKNEGEDGKLGNEESPMIPVRNVPYASGAERIQSLKFKIQSWGRKADGAAEFVDLRLKTTFQAEGHPEGWTPNGERKVQGPMTNLQSWKRTPSTFGYGWTMNVLYFHSKAAEDHRQNVGAAGMGSNVCRATSSSRSFWKWFTDFQLFPLNSSCFRSFDYKNIFQNADTGPGVRAAGTWNSAKLA
jgi:hypothetical protein